MANDALGPMTTAMEKATNSLRALALQALSEIGSVLDRMPPDAGEIMCTEILNAHRIACYGVGREGLMMKALCMRLMHLGMDVHVVGDVTVPPLGPGDLLIASAGPGYFSTVMALLGVAHDAGASTVVITAQPDSHRLQDTDVVIELQAKTMADDPGKALSILPMGSLYEVSQLIFFDVVCLMLREKVGQSPEQMRARHTNLE